MLVRHIGGFVNDIEKVSNILIQLGYIKIYDEIESIGKVQKFILEDNRYIEIIEQNYKRHSLNTWHISINSDIPDFLHKYKGKCYKARNTDLIVTFVYINDTIYFEFVRDKNEL